MKHARGDMRKLLIAIGEIQQLIGNARGLHDDDQNPRGFEDGQKQLHKAFELCVTATSEYYPVNPPHNNANSGEFEDAR